MRIEKEVKSGEGKEREKMERDRERAQTVKMRSMDSIAL